MRDADGWYRVPGYWNTPKTRARTMAAPAPTDWRVAGPPAEEPEETPGPAPGPNSFYVPGHYTPDGDRLAWTPGFWADGQPGWDWIPARWVRRPNGWDYREGYWLRDSDAVRRHEVARPVPYDRGDLPPAIVVSEPTDKDKVASPPGVRPRDPIDEAEAAREMRGGLLVPEPYVLPRYAYGPGAVVIRPPGMYPYGPGGVVVPAAVPPFVQRLLNRVLP
ncbi:MAG: hypothetical protein P4L84_25195 [Isosphaeraceae bacterium]|nr:hypothetical protein [Isosphaeraceae bacterium]